MFCVSRFWKNYGSKIASGILSINHLSFIANDSEAEFFSVESRARELYEYAFSAYSYNYLILFYI